VSELRSLRERAIWRDGFACAMRIIHAGVILRGDDDLANRLARLTIPRAAWTGQHWPMRKKAKP
jgi:hypothetical protein